MELIIVFTIGAALLLGFALSSLTAATPTQRRIARLVDGSHVRIDTPTSEGVRRERQRGWLGRLVAPLEVRGATARGVPTGALRKRLIQAGYRRESAVSVYLGSRIVLSAAVGTALLVASATWALSELQIFVMLGCGAAIGYVAPSYWIDRRRNRRARQIELGLPDALDLMVVCVEAGLGINASLARVAREFTKSHVVLSAEFELVTLEVRAGKSMSEALRSFGDRTGVSQIGSLVAMLLQTERFGTNLAATLRVHADAMRSRRLQRAEEQAAKAPLKMLFPTVLIFIATLLVTIGPGVVRMMSFLTDEGWAE